MTQKHTCLTCKNKGCTGHCRFSPKPETKKTIYQIQKAA